MSNNTYCRSLAGTGKRYVSAQATVIQYPFPLVHVQIAGQHGNRSYGFAVNLGDPDLFAYVKAELDIASRTLSSLAGTGKRYIPCQLRIWDKTRVNVQIAGHEGNREYGNAAKIANAEAWAYLADVNGIEPVYNWGDEATPVVEATETWVDTSNLTPDEVDVMELALDVEELADDMEALTKNVEYVAEDVAALDDRMTRAFVAVNKLEFRADAQERRIAALEQLVVRICGTL